MSTKLVFDTTQDFEWEDYVHTLKFMQTLLEIQLIPSIVTDACGQEIWVWIDYEDKA